MIVGKFRRRLRPPTGYEEPELSCDDMVISMETQEPKLLRMKKKEGIWGREEDVMDLEYHAKTYARNL